MGLGSIGKRHLRLAREFFPNSEIRIFRHQKPSDYNEVSDGCIYSLKDALLFAPHLAVISNPATFHIYTAQALAEAGVHLLVEKPISASLEGVSKLIETCKSNKVVLSVGYNLRFLASLQYFKKLLESSEIGDVISLRCEVGQNLHSWRLGADYRTSVSGQKKLGGGVLLELSHELDYLRWVFGDIEWIKATLSTQSALEIDVEDSVFITVGFVPEPDKKQLIGSLNMDFIRHDQTRNCIAIGADGSLRWNGLTGRVDKYSAGSKVWEELSGESFKIDDSYRSEWSNFIHCVKNDDLPSVSGTDGLAVLKIVEAARKASTTGDRVYLAEMNTLGSVKNEK